MKRALGFKMNAFPSTASAAFIRCISVLSEHACGHDRACIESKH